MGQACPWYFLFNYLILFVCQRLKSAASFEEPTVVAIIKYLNSFSIYLSSIVETILAKLLLMRCNTANPCPNGNEPARMGSQPETDKARGIGSSPDGPVGPQAIGFFQGKGYAEWKDFGS
jgi:hypothetical protein